MQAVHVLHISSKSFQIPADQNILPSANNFDDPGCPKCSASNHCFLSSSGTTVLSPENSRPKCSENSVKTGENSSGARSFQVFRKQTFSSSSFGSTEVLWIRVFESIMKLSLAFLRFSFASAFTIFGTLIVWFTWI